MAQPSVLSEKGLARFRTKQCERLLAFGVCAYRSKCQYSHDCAWLRRNPSKRDYQPQLCPYVKAADGCGGGCSHGESCSFAHSNDEVQYHPQMYKTVICPGGDGCGGFYCPFAHSPAELRSRNQEAAKAAERRKKPSASTGATSDDSSKSPRAAADLTVAGTGSSAEHVDGSAPTNGSRWWDLDERLSVAGEARGAMRLPSEAVASGPDSGEALAGGRTVPGQLKGKAQDGSAVPCRVKLVPAARAEREQAAQVIKELRRWMAMDSKGAPNRALALRRTVATACLALPEVEPPTLAQCVRRGLAGGIDGTLAGKSIAELCDSRSGVAAAVQAAVVAQAAAWIRQLAQSVAELHAASCAHTCLSPATSVVTEDGGLRAGDFLGKIRTLCALERGWEPMEGQQVDTGCSAVGGASCHREPNHSWAMWYPAEVQLCVTQASPDGAANPKHSLDLRKSDSWQLGVAVFFLLTGEHLFGDRSEPATVCKNILQGDAVNMRLLARSLPLFADLVARLVAHTPQNRPSIDALLAHPALWHLDAAYTAVTRSPRLLPAAGGHSVSQLLPALAPGRAGVPERTTTGAPFKSSSDFLAALGLEECELVKALDRDVVLPPPGLPPQAVRPAETTAAAAQAAPPPAGGADLNDKSIGVGSILRCIWHGGVRYRRTRNRDSRLGRSAHCGVEVFVKERAGNWIRAKHGWLPLRGVGEAEGRWLFEQVDLRSISTDAEIVLSTDPSPHGSAQSSPVLLLEAPPGLSPASASAQPAPWATPTALAATPLAFAGAPWAFAAPPAAGASASPAAACAPPPGLAPAGSKDAAFEALLSWAKLDGHDSSARTPASSPTENLMPAGFALNPNAESWFPTPQTRSFESVHEPIKVQAHHHDVPRAPTPPLELGIPAYVQTGDTPPMSSSVPWPVTDESYESFFQNPPLSALLGLAGPECYACDEAMRIFSSI